MHHNYVDSSSLAAYAACQFIPLDKKSVCPIGSSEVLQRIFVMKITRQAWQYVTGSSQPCASQIGGCKAAEHNKADFCLFLLMVFY